MGLALDQTEKRPTEWLCFYTKGAKTGQCKEEEEEF